MERLERAVRLQLGLNKAQEEMDDLLELFFAHDLLVVRVRDICRSGHKLVKSADLLKVHLTFDKVRVLPQLGDKLLLGLACKRL